jgi:hypothetical protein
VSLLDEKERYLPAREASEILHVAYGTVKEWYEKNRFPTKRAKNPQGRGSSAFYKVALLSDVEAYADDRRFGQAPVPCAPLAKYLREYLGDNYSIEEFARSIGMHESTPTKILNGIKSHVRFDTADKILSFIDCEWAWYLDPDLNSVYGLVRSTSELKVG